MSPFDTTEVLARLLAAVAVGALLGIDRELRHKPIGPRTLALVSLGSASICVATIRLDVLAGEPDASSRVIQGVIQGVAAGIGFIGAGVVLQRPTTGKVRGLTTAAAVWIAGALGIACGVGAWRVVLISTLLALVVLVGLTPLDDWLEKRAKNQRDQ